VKSEGWGVRDAGWRVEDWGVPHRGWCNNALEDDNRIPILSSSYSLCKAPQCETKTRNCHTLFILTASMSRGVVPNASHQEQHFTCNYVESTINMFYVNFTEWRNLMNKSPRVTQKNFLTESDNTSYHLQGFYIFSPWRNSLYRARASSLSRLHDYTQTHHTRYDSSGRVINPTQRPLPENTKHSQETQIHDLGGIRTRNPSKRSAADPRLRPRSHWDRPNFLYTPLQLRTESRIRIHVDGRHL
jgi:hypothetical protein